MTAKLNTEQLLKAMLKASVANAKNTALMDQYKAIGEQVKVVREGAYATAMRIAKQAESHASFCQAYEGYKVAIRKDGHTVDSSVRSAFSAVKTSWDALAGAKGTTVAGTIRGKAVHYAVPESANDIPAALESFSAMRQAADLHRKGSQQEGATKADGALPADLTTKLEALRGHMIKADSESAHAALDAALAYFLVGKAPRKAAKATTTGKEKAASRTAARKAQEAAA